MNNDIFNEEKKEETNVQPTIDFEKDDSIKSEAQSLDDPDKKVNVLDLSNTNISSSLLNKEKDVNEINTIHINRIVAPTAVNTNQEEVEPHYKEIPINTKHSKNLLFIVVLLLLIAILLGTIMFLVYPKITEKTPVINHVPTKKTTKLVLYDFNDVEISNTEITSSGEFRVSEEFTIKTTKKNNQVDIEVNDKLITTNDRLYNKIAMVDDLLLFAVDNSKERSATLYIVDTKGNVVNSYTHMGEVDMRIAVGPSSISYNEGYIAVVSTRVDGENLYLNNDALNICNKEALKKAGVSDDLAVISVYKIIYNGDHKFGEPASLNYVTLSEYLETDTTCN